MVETENRVALITGSARGIGLATAQRFFADGWRVAMLDIDAANVAAAAARFAEPARILALAADVSDPASVASAMATLGAKFGRLDALVNNAGIAIFKAAIETPLADWSRVLAVNLTGPFLVTMAAVPLLRVEGGSIVNITSISGLRASTMRVAYGTSKAGLAHLTKQLAIELASLGIRVNAVAPGPVDTAMAKDVHTPEIRADYRDAVPLGRYGLESELAEAVYFLSSSRANYVTGQILAVDGGFEAAGIGLATFRRDYPTNKV
jgi:NAD(P)-dependent dehydrogenase (short-subunit alcohol dehydrogenase family)